MADRRMIQRKSGTWTTVKTQALKKLLRAQTPSGYVPWRPLLGNAITFVLLILGLPVLGLVALLIKLTSPGPVFYTQRRLGKDGQVYTIYKLRTMYHDCEGKTGPRWSGKGDRRVTPMGRFLRLVHLDELPQLWNVLRGEMSLIGPRPERPEFVYELDRNVNYYRSRMTVLPGVTGLAQVLLPADTDLDSVRIKLKYDLYYLQYCSPLLDLQILIATVFKIFNVPYSIIRLLVCLPRRKQVDRAYQELVAMSWAGTGHLVLQSRVEAPCEVPVATPKLVSALPVGH